MALSALHETFVKLFRNRPELAPELLRDALGFAVPHYTDARIESANFNEAKAVQLQADLVVLLVDDTPVLAIVVEVQLHCDADKHFSWPAYLAAARKRFRCDAVVLVFAPDKAVATWAGEAIPLGPGNEMTPLVLGAGAVPVVRDHEQARRAPELAVLSASAHGSNAELGAEVAFAAAIATSDLPNERATLYWDLVMASLNDATRTALEEMMTSGNYEYQSDFAKKYFAEGEAQALLRILASRRLEVTAAQREQVLACRDLDLLGLWIERAIAASSTEEVLAD